MGLKKDSLDDLPAAETSGAKPARGREITLDLPPGREAVSLGGVRERALRAQSAAAAAPAPVVTEPAVPVKPLTVEAAAMGSMARSPEKPPAARVSRTRSATRRAPPAIPIGRGAFAHSTRDGSRQAVAVSTRFHPRLLDYLNYYVSFMDIERDIEIAVGDVHQAALADYLEAQFRLHGLNPDTVPDGGKYRPIARAETA